MRHRAIAGLAIVIALTTAGCTTKGTVEAPRQPAATQANGTDPADVIPEAKAAGQAVDQLNQATQDAQDAATGD